jgi:uncharacterized membrane protein YfcA
MPVWMSLPSWPLVGADPVLGLLLGLVLGGVGGVFGIGGGLMAIPVLGWCFGLDQQLAQGTALVMVAPNVLLGFWRYKQRNPIDLRQAALLGLSAAVSAYATARVATHIDAHSLRAAFAVFLMAMAAMLLWGLRPQGACRPARVCLGPRWMGLLGLGSGVLSGLFTVGGGVVATPVLTGLFGVRKLTTAQGLSLALVAPGTLVALLAYASAGKVNWGLGLPMAAGGLLSVSWGVALAHSLPEQLLRMLFCAMLAATAWAMF